MAKSKTTKAKAKPKTIGRADFLDKELSKLFGNDVTLIKYKPSVRGMINRDFPMGQKFLLKDWILIGHSLINKAIQTASISEAHAKTSALLQDKTEETAFANQEIHNLKQLLEQNNTGRQRLSAALTQAGQKVSELTNDKAVLCTSLGLLEASRVRESEMLKHINGLQQANSYMQANATDGALTPEYKAQQGIA